LISGNTALVGRSLKGFTQTDENTYVTENFDTAKRKININLSGALADFEVKIYDSEK
jgi:predicted membrane protein